jgi:uncharacterized membrane-anchored protein
MTYRSPLISMIAFLFWAAVQALLLGMLWRWVSAQPGDNFGAGAIWYGALLLFAFSDLVWIAVLVVRFLRHRW